MTSAAERRGLIEASMYAITSVTGISRHPRQNAAASLKHMLNGGRGKLAYDDIRGRTPRPH